MPMKPKTHRKKVLKKKAFRKAVGAPAQIIFYDNKRLNPYPRRYVTKIHSSVYGAFPANSSVGNSSIFVNSRLPYAGSGLPSLTSPSVSTLGGTGFNNLCNANFYRGYRVTGFRMTIEFIPQASGDSVVATITPSTLTTLPASTPTALSQPFTKKGNFSSNKNNTNTKRGNAISLSMKLHNFFGVNKMIYDNALDTTSQSAYNANPTRAVYVIINWNTMDSVVLSSNLEYRLDLVQDIQFFEQDAGNLNQIAP